MTMSRMTEFSSSSSSLNLQLVAMTERDKSRYTEGSVLRSVSESCIRGNRRGQPNHSAMEEPHPGGTDFVITVSPTPDTSISTKAMLFVLFHPSSSKSSLSGFKTFVLILLHTYLQFSAVVFAFTRVDKDFVAFDES
ncbi:hypothetical protein EVAR_89453_1 [Eumeta japonica]|uniref:Uncharacterized protein n=1 Tax=Eumeta variegata TaxID=151549 RepID=A0A4C1Z4W0_EUMVA|nr:hypothetical protein EVAR_89453_1 [Eumeta japonica]